MNLANEAELVERARLGDRAAAGLLVRRHEGTVYATALARLRDVDDAREVAQEALLRGLSTLPKLREASRFGAYVARIAVHLAADRKRRLRRRETLPDLADRRPGPLDTLTRRERQRRLLVEMERLPEEARQVFLLRHVEGLSYKGIAALLEIPQGTVAWTLHRARRSLRASLRDLALEDER